jgi:hypothetical protein
MGVLSVFGREFLPHAVQMRRALDRVASTVRVYRVRQ